MSDRDDDAVGTPARLGYELGAETAEEAHDFEAVAAQLGLAAEPVTPPASLKADLFAKLASTPQLPPLETDASPAQPEPASAPPAPAPAPPAPASAPAAPASAPPAPAPAPVAPTPETPTPETPAETRARSRWFTRPIAIAAAAAAAVVLFVGGTFLGNSLAGNDSFQQQQASALAAINAAPDAQRATADVDGGGTATLVWSGQLGQSALVAKGLPSLPNDKTYELWYIRDGKATAAGTMTPGDAPATWRVLEGTMAAGDTVGVTVEPRGGSTQPTTNPIVAISS
ncbi:anti-sigma factor [Leifsonia sp. NPDC058292]|uniref:anti-sigma factor n=1 Tax=Leifsonia sp. NPDC058292 TaxID=3346428 RepID=UPI0036D7A699